ncbi:MAG: hypothetical protein GQ570_09435 [Helicobacteraceae bacterium]|nr:hypothetical protein [Helicobacteraceae bacterium]
MRVSVLSFVAIGFFVYGCGGAGTNGYDSNSYFGTSETVIVPCSAPVTSYVELTAGDTIENLVDNTVIITYHDEDGVKRVCVESGSAKVISTN